MDQLVHMTLVLFRSIHSQSIHACKSKLLLRLSDLILLFLMSVWGVGRKLLGSQKENVMSLLCLTNSLKTG